MSIAYIGIGSNLGRKKENCLKAIQILKDKGLKVTKQSSMFDTKPWGIKNQPEFINMAVEIETELSPYKLLCLLKKIENEMGRENIIKWGPRIIDLDILLYDDLLMNTYELKIPHPLMHKREFVLQPLAEIAPEKVHPVLGKKIKDILQELLSS